MRISLDHAIFGNGYGLRSPLNDNRFYWLVDTMREPRSARNGELYTYMAGLGAQLHSHQWRHPKAGERRRLNGREYVVLHSRRRWLRVEVAWSLARLPGNLAAAHSEIRAIKIELDAM